MYARFFLPFLALLALAASGFGQALLSNGDSFEMRLSGMPLEYAQEYFLNFTVADDGTVTVPYIGQMRASGLSTTQFCRSVEKKLIDEKIFTGPTVIINLQASSRFVTIGGEVRAPQAIVWTTNLSLSSAITRVGGPTDFTQMKKVRVTRNGQVQVFNLKNAQKDPTQNPKLLPGDEVDVQ